jgi:integrase
MPRSSKGPRLWLEPEERGKDGKLVRHAAWVVRDGSRKVRTGCAPDDRQGAERALADYITGKYQVPRERGRDPAEILILDVLNLYLKERAPGHARPEETRQRVMTLADFWLSSTLADVTGQRCREYVASREGQPWKSAKPEATNRQARLVSPAAARRELEDLRAAINHHRKEGLCSQVVSVVLPAKSQPREVFLERSEAARILWAAWRARQVMRDERTRRDVGQHVARFMLVGLYTGTRHAAIVNAAFQPAIGRGYIDLERGVFYRRAQGSRATKKRQTPVRLPAPLLAHLRRWQRLGIAQHAAVEWNGKPVKSVRKAFANAVRAAGIDKHVTPHTLRHTSATWMMRDGANLWEAAGFLGMTAEMLERTYGHHHPDFQVDAARAAAGQDRDRMTVNKTRRTDTNATKNAEFTRRAR